jgi:ATP-binding protein involved in chromosome partitioning
MTEPEQNTGTSAPHQNRFGKTIAVASGKGGVGKSTVAVNIAVALSEAGYRVGLLDADIYGPNVPMMMGVGQMPEPEGDKLVPAQSFGIKVMSIGFLVPSGQPLIWRGPMLHSAIRQFVADVAWGELDYLIVDLPPGTGDAQLSLAQTMTLSGGLIVTLPQQVSLEDARRGLEMFRSMNVPVLGVVENMSFLELPDGTRMDIFGEGGGKRLAEASGVPFLGQIPMDPEVRKGGDEGKPIVISNPESPAAKSFQKLVKNLEQAIPGESPDQPGQIKIEITD